MKKKQQQQDSEVRLVITDDAPRFLAFPEIEKRYSITNYRLQQLRFQRKGPPFVRLGYRSVLYDRVLFEKWLAELPQDAVRRNAMPKVRATPEVKTRAGTECAATR